MNNQKPIFDLHAEHNEWLNKLSFYQDELAVMQNRITEIAARNTGNDVMAMVEHFQNQFTIQSAAISNFRHEIKRHENEIENSVKDNPVAADHRKGNDHSAEKENMAQFETIFSDLKKELNAFLSKTM